MQGLRWAMMGVVLALQLFMAGRAIAGAGPATESIRGTIDEVFKVLDDQDLKKPERHEDRRQRLEKVVGARFDYAEMSRRSLGAQWNQLSEKERQEFVDLFRTLLTNTYADRVENYSGEGVQYLNERTGKICVSAWTEYGAFARSSAASANRIRIGHR